MADDALHDWYALNRALMACADERQLLAWLAAEQGGKRRPTFIKRIYARLNKVRANRERQTLLGNSVP